jgi:hypothetical protein
MTCCVYLPKPGGAIAEPRTLAEYLAAASEDPNRDVFLRAVADVANARKRAKLRDSR